MLSDATAVIVGHVTGEPRVTRPKADASLLVFTVAVNRLVAGKTETLWCRVELWAPKPELVARVRIGSYVRVVGSLYPARWTGKDGLAHAGFAVRYPSILVLDPGRRNGPADAEGGAETADPGPQDF